MDSRPSEKKKVLGCPESLAPVTAHADHAVQVLRLVMRAAKQRWRDGLDDEGKDSALSWLFSLEGLYKAG